MKNISLPAAYIHNIKALHGQDGLLWLDTLPQFIEKLESEWQFEFQSVFANLSFNFVGIVLLGTGTEAVLKIGFPTNQEFKREAEALAIFGGQASIQVLHYDPKQSAMLLEYAKPGNTLLTIKNDSEATSIAAGLMKIMWKPAPASSVFPTIAEWGQGFGRFYKHPASKTTILEPRLVDKAARLFFELEKSMTNPVMLHGDLHHENMLSAQRLPWLMIDPKGLIGEPEYEVGAFIRNPLPRLLKTTHPQKILARRLDQFAEELGFNRDRIAGWAFSQAVLSDWWWIEDGQPDWPYLNVVSGWLEPLL